MRNLIKAEIYKETRKRSFKIILFLLPIICLITLLVLRNNAFENTLEVKLSEDEYNSLYKHGDYEKYDKLYDKYLEGINKEAEIKSLEEINMTRNLSVNSTFIYFVISFFVIYIVFSSFSYDVNYGTNRYVFMSNQGRSKIFLSKIIALVIISLFIMIYMSLFSLVVSSLIGKSSFVYLSKYVYFNSKFIKLPLVIYHLLKCFVFTVPLVFFIVLTSFVSILFNGNIFGCILLIMLNLMSTTILDFLLGKGITIASYSFLPYLDFSYFSNSDYLLVNALFNVNLELYIGVIILFVYLIVFYFVSLMLYKRDI